MRNSIHQCRRAGCRLPRWRAGCIAAVVVLLALCAAVGRADSEGAPAAQGEAAPEPSGILLNFRDAPLAAVLEHLSEAGGLAIVEEAVVEGRVTLMSRQPLDVQEAVALLNTVLVDKGYAAVRSGRVLKIVTLEDAKKMNVPVRSGIDPRAIEPTDEVITQIIPLKFTDARQLQQDLGPLIPDYAALAANASSNALILTDTSANVRRIVEIVRILDTHMATVAQVRVFPLAYADASDAAALVNEVFAQEDVAAGQQRAMRFGRGQLFRGPRGDGEAERSPEAASRAPRVLAAADERTNTVVVSGWLGFPGPAL